MTPFFDTTTAVSQLESAMECDCAALVALQAAGLDGHELPPGMELAETELLGAIAATRRVIADLRAIADQRADLLAYGFVVGEDGEDPGERISPRRAGPRRWRPAPGWAGRASTGCWKRGSWQSEG